MKQEREDQRTATLDRASSNIATDFVQKYAKNAHPLINTNAIPITGFKIVPLLSHNAIDPTKNHTPSNKKKS